MAAHHSCGPYSHLFGRCAKNPIYGRRRHNPFAAWPSMNVAKLETASTSMKPPSLISRCGAGLPKPGRQWGRRRNGMRTHRPPERRSGLHHDEKHRPTLRFFPECDRQRESPNGDWCSCALYASGSSCFTRNLPPCRVHFSNSGTPNRSNSASNSSRFMIVMPWWSPRSSRCLSSEMMYSAFASKAAAITMSSFGSAGTDP